MGCLFCPLTNTQRRLIISRKIVRVMIRGRFFRPARVNLRNVIMILLKERSRLLLLLLAGALFFCIPLMNAVPRFHDGKGVEAPVLSVVIQNRDVDTPSAIETSEYKVQLCKSASHGFKLSPLLFQASLHLSSIPTSFSKQKLPILRC
jgi:hypothetical protein